jgi:hypothetical protein
MITLQYVTRTRDVVLMSCVRARRVMARVAGTAGLELMGPGQMRPGFAFAFLAHGFLVRGSCLRVFAIQLYCPSLENFGLWGTWLLAGLFLHDRCFFQGCSHPVRCQGF